MDDNKITREQIEAFSQQLLLEEKSRATREKYLRDVRQYAVYMGNEAVTAQRNLSYKQYLEEHYAPSSANSMIAAVNAFFKFLGWDSLRLRRFRIQQKVYCPETAELTKEDYEKLVSSAKSSGNIRLSLLLQTVCATGIRVSELAYVTREAVQAGEASVNCKGKKRTVFLVSKLRKKLLRYAKEKGIRSGPIFVTKNGLPLDRSNIWKEMKALFRRAGVAPGKVFPHNLRHLFARTFYAQEKDIVKLADILGHSSINTTRIYTISTGAEHRRRMERMHLLV